MNFHKSQTKHHYKCRSFILRTEPEAERILAAYATEENQIMFTTSWNHRSEFSNDTLEKVLHIWESLRSVGRVQNAVILTYEMETCQVLWAKGITCLVDRLQSQPPELPGECLILQGIA